MARILYLTQIDIDFGVVTLLPAECERTGMRRPLVVTDAGVRAAGVLQLALDALGALPHAVFDGTPSHPTEAAVRASTPLHTNACRCCCTCTAAASSSAGWRRTTACAASSHCAAAPP